MGIQSLSPRLPDRFQALMMIMTRVRAPGTASPSSVVRAARATPKKVVSDVLPPSLMRSTK